MKFLRVQTEVAARAVGRRSQLISGVVVRHDGGQVIVVAGAQSFGAQPIVAIPLIPGDRVWLQMGHGQPKVIGLQSRDEGVSDG